MSLFLPVFFAAMLHMAKPGPFIMGATSFALSGQWKQILVFSGATILAGTATYFLLLGGLSLLPEHFGMVFVFLKGAAAALFVTLGLKGLAVAPSSEDGEKKRAELEAQGFTQTAIAAFLLSLSNPFDLVFILAAVPTLSGQMDFTALEILVVRLAHITAHIIVVTAYCLPIFWLRHRFSEPVLNAVRKVASCGMIAIGLYIFGSLIIGGDLQEAGLLSDWI